MACACGKNKAQTGLAAKADTKAKATREAEARAATSTSRLNPQPAKMQGRQQSFSMQSGDKTARFGSRLERDAAVARSGGRPV